MPGPSDILYDPEEPLYRGFMEGDLVEQPAINLFAELEWQTANLFGEFAAGKSSEGRESKREAFLPIRLKAALAKLNPTLPASAIEDAFAEITRERSSLDPVRANAELHDVLLNGVKVDIREAGNAARLETLRVIDWQDPGTNDFLIASQVWFAGDLYTRRADLVGFINGLPLLLIELKGLHRALSDAYDGNLTDYRWAIPQVFTSLGFVILSNGIDARLGAPLADLDHFAAWKKIDDEEEEGRISLETLIRGTCRPARFLDLLENFIAFQEDKAGLVKKLAKNHQLLGVNRALGAVEKLKENQGRLGVFWHTQGSGKSLSMLFLARKVQRKLPGDWTFLIVTDRTELDDQIAGTFSSCGALVKNLEEVQAQSRDHLKELLRGNERYVFTLIQKFGAERGEAFPVLSERSDIIVITDEAHRTQYGLLAANMRAALPNAAFIAFTGTPLIRGEEQRTKEIFGDYVSIYDFGQSIADGATVPLYYDSRMPELQLAADDLDADIAAVLEEAGLDEEAEEKVATRFARQYHLITNNDRLDKVAQDLVRHFTQRGYRGKAMFVAIDKATAVAMYNKVRCYWREMLAKEKAHLATIADLVEKEALAEHLAWLEQTDMAVVVSQAQNEQAQLAAKGLDIKPHRERMVKEDLDEKFKAPDDPLRLVFVCAMWITGFDVPTCSTIYLDKPMRNHSLMQTIARANRVAPGKQAGLIVDYVGVFRNLQEALAIYARPCPGGDDMPVKEKQELLKEFEAALGEALEFAAKRGVLPADVINAHGFERQARIKAAAEAILGPDDDKQTYLRLVGKAWRLFKAILPDPGALAHRGDVVVLQVVAETIRGLTRPDGKKLAEVLAEIERLVDQAISGAAIRAPIPTGNDLKQLFDLSKIDFDKLAEMFKSGSKKTATEVLRNRAKKKAEELAAKNPTRQGYLVRLQELIDRYNVGSLDVQVLFDELMAFVGELDDEEKRHLREGLSEEELAIFDILTKPEPKLTNEQEIKVKAIARRLLETLKREKLILDWRSKDGARSGVREAIKHELDDLPEVYGRPLWEEKVRKTYEFVYERFPASTSAAS